MTALDRYVTLGRSGLRVSPLCLGTMTFGSGWGFGSDTDEAVRVMERYIERGGNFLDTANIYTKGESEKIIGDYLKQHKDDHATNAKRDRIVLATKFLGNMYTGDPNGGGAHRKAIINACEQSLRRLQTDYIDLYWMHFWDALTPIDETMRAIDDLVRDGKIRYFGISDTPAWKCAQAQTLADLRGWTPSIALQIEYSLIERTVENELLPMAEELGMGVTPWSPLKGGLLTGKYTRANIDGANLEGVDAKRKDWLANKLDDRAATIIETLVRVAEQAGATPAATALAWTLAKTPVASTIIGARTLAQLDANLAAMDVELTPEHVETLDAASQQPPTFPQSFLPATRNNVYGGTTINSVPSAVWHLAPESDAERF